MLDEARVEADQILQGARTEADTLASERDRRKAEVEAEMAEMTQLVAGVRTRLAVLATTVADKLDEMDAVVSGKAAGAAEPEPTEEEPAVPDEFAETAGDEADTSIDAAADVEMEPEAVEEAGDGDSLVDLSEMAGEGPATDAEEDGETETSTEEEASESEAGETE
jgi:hypothetical protein